VSKPAAGCAPAAYPPPIDTQREFIKRTLDGDGQRVEVGVAVVGGGTAGLACANRLMQLLADDPQTSERLGEVPVAVIEKATVCGGHTLSGAVMNPGPLLELFPGSSREEWRNDGFAFGEVTKEAVYVLPNARTKVRIPVPAPQHNRGNEVISVAALARYQARMAEAAGAYVLTETAATQLIVEEGKVVGVRSGEKGRGKDGEPRHNFEPGNDIKAQAVVLGDGSWGHLTGAAIREFGLAADREPQVWELGVKEVWKVARPLDRVIHTLAGWPLKISSKYHQIGGSWIYPMKDTRTGEDLVSIGFILDLGYADATSSPHDFLQLIKTHPLFRNVLAGGERVAWGAKALPAGGYWAVPKLSMPGAVLVGDAGGLVNLASLKGVHYAIKSGMLAAESIYAGLRRGDSDFTSYEQAIDESFIGQELYKQRNTRQPFQKGLLKGGPLVQLMIATKGRFPGGRWSVHTDDSQPMFIGNSKSRYPKPDGNYIFDKLSSVFITGNATRDDAPNHIRIQRRVPRELAETWRWMCPAAVYEIADGAPAQGAVDVTVNYTNCVQCGAITAKGGRLTPPEGGDGPHYQLT
jgi:electron-transferring-flavoprotein dehydrogenase